MKKTDIDKNRRAGGTINLCEYKEIIIENIAIIGIHKYKYPGGTVK